MNKKRWLYVIVGVMVLILAGLVYAWSVLSSPIAAYFPDWSKAQLSLTFTLCMTFFCFGGLAGGMLSGKIDTKFNIWVAGILFFVGFYIASISNTPLMLYIGYGMFCGFASGLAYNAVLSTMLAWFPDKQGLISGILLMGFGLGSFFIAKIYQAYTPAGIDIQAWRSSFMTFGIILLLAFFIAGFFFVKPKTEDVAVYIKYNKSKQSSVYSYEATTSQMLKTSGFWFYFLWAVFLSAAGLAVISQAGGIVREVGNDISPAVIATAVGLISVANGIGRVIFGGCYDRIGRKVTMSIVTLAFMSSVTIILFAIIFKTFNILVAGFLCTGFSYGGINPTNSAFISDFYGRKNYAMNFSIINLNLLISSFGSTIAGILYDKSGSYLSTFIIMIIVAFLAMICNILIKKPKLN